MDFNHCTTRLLMILLISHSYCYININKLVKCKVYSTIDNLNINSIHARNSIYSSVNNITKSNQIDINIRKSFFNSRDWNIPIKIWKKLIQNDGTISHKLFDTTDSKYCITNLNEIEQIGKESEFIINNSRYQTRKTYALRIGYVGNEYYGYQSQRSNEFLTVEDDIRLALKTHCYASGRTDSRVSAISQIICFTSIEYTNSSQILDLFSNLESIKQGKLNIFECVRVPRKFNSRSSALWRKYVYLFPLNILDRTNNYDVDVEFTNRALKKLINKDLPYHAFSRGEDRTIGDGMKDYCTIFYSNARVIQIPDGDISNHVISFELVGNRFLRNMVRVLLATVIRESLLPDDERNENVLVDLCLSSDRLLTEIPLPGDGLGLAGVGYDLHDLSLYQNMPKFRKLQIESKYQTNKPNSLTHSNEVHSSTA